MRVVHHHVVGDVRIQRRRQRVGRRVDVHSTVVVVHVDVGDRQQRRVLDVHRHDRRTRDVEDLVAAVLDSAPLDLHGRVQFADVHEVDAAAQVVSHVRVHHLLSVAGACMQK